jgi:hypothetical protein
VGADRRRSELLRKSAGSTEPQPSQGLFTEESPGTGLVIPAEAKIDRVIQIPLLQLMTVVEFFAQGRFEEAAHLLVPVPTIENPDALGHRLAHERKVQNRLYLAQEVAPGTSSSAFTYWKSTGSDR